MRTADEIRQNSLDKLNAALLRLGMFGPEVVARLFLDEVAFIEDREAELDAHFDALRKRRAFMSTGVTGAFAWHTHMEPTHDEIASVYAEIAFQMGYLNTTRVLDRTEFEALHRGLRKTCRNRDFTTEEVLQEFGTPSWRTGPNRSHPEVFLYLTAQPKFGAIAFDFWNELLWSCKNGEWARHGGFKYGDLPVLRNVRIRGTSFGREFTFTPLGRVMTGRA